LRRFLDRKKTTVTCEKSVEDVEIRRLLSEVIVDEYERDVIRKENHRDHRSTVYHFGDVDGDIVITDVDDSKNVASGKEIKQKVRVRKTNG
jgi:hypothetical protein